MRLPTSFTLPFLFLVACNGAVAPIDPLPSDRAASGQTPPGSSAKEPPQSTPHAPTSPAPSACASASSVSSAPYYSSMADLAQRLGGVWAACPGNASYAFGGPAGFEVTSDGHFYGLDEVNGQLVRQTGFGHEGAFTLVSNGSGLLPYAMFDDESFRVPFTAFTSDGQVVQLADEAGPASYARTTAAVVVPPTEPGMAREGAAGCSKAETKRLGFVSTIDAQQAILGEWSICSNGWLASGASGIAIDADGTWHYLVDATTAGDAGQSGGYGGAPPPPPPDPNARGTYSLYATGSGFDGSTIFQLDFTIPGGTGTVPTHFAVSSSPVKLWLSSEGGGAILSSR